MHFSKYVYQKNYENKIGISKVKKFQLAPAGRFRRDARANNSPRRKVPNAGNAAYLAPAAIRRLEPWGLTKQLTSKATNSNIQ